MTVNCRACVGVVFPRLKLSENSLRIWLFNLFLSHISRRTPRSCLFLTIRSNRFNYLSDHTPGF